MRSFIHKLKTMFEYDELMAFALIVCVVIVYAAMINAFAFS